MRTHPIASNRKVSALVQISVASEKGRIRRYLTERKGLPSKRQAQWYL